MPDLVTQGRAWADNVSLEELFAEAGSYGKLRVSCMNDRTWYSQIEFATASGIQLEAKSEFNHETPQEAIKLAIDRAEQIRSQFK